MLHALGLALIITSLFGIYWSALLVKNCDIKYDTMPIIFMLGTLLCAVAGVFCLIF